jgi:hypothetical protein
MTLQESNHQSINFWEVIETPKWQIEKMNISTNLRLKMTLQKSKHRSINFWGVIETPKWQIEKMNISTNLDGQINLHSMYPNIYFREFV